MTHEELILLKKLMLEALSSIKPFISNQDFSDVCLYIDNGEFGVGWELLWHIVLDDDLEMPPSLVDAGIIMKFDVINNS